MNATTTYRWSFEEDVTQYREAGFDAAGLWLRKLRDFGEERAAELLRESGLGVSSLSWVGGFTGADASTARENLDEALRAIDLAAEVRAGCLVVHPGGRNGHTARHADRLVRGALERLIPHAERMGVTLALEPMRPECAADWTVVGGVDAVADLVCDFDTTALRIVLDSYQFSTLAGCRRQASELAPLLAVVQLADYVEPRGCDHGRLPLGEGDAPLGEFVESLLDAGYQGVFETKLSGPEVEARDYHGLLRASREQLTRLTEATVSRRSQSEFPACNATWLSTTA